jgi:hypothetical protein
MSLPRLDMICHKIGRIINGDPDYADSWHDIAGYAQLVANRLNGVADAICRQRDSLMKIIQESPVTS